MTREQCKGCPHLIIEKCPDGECYCGDSTINIKSITNCNKAHDC